MNIKSLVEGLGKQIEYFRFSWGFGHRHLLMAAPTGKVARCPQCSGAVEKVVFCNRNAGVVLTEPCGHSVEPRSVLESAL